MKTYLTLIKSDAVKKNANISSLVGKYVSIGHPFIKEFELKEEDIVIVDKQNGHKVGCCKSNTKSNELYGINLYFENIVQHSKYVQIFLNSRSLPKDEPIYTFILHSDGVIRFKINNKMTLLEQWMWSYMDSNGIIDNILNLKHLMENGCFCFGLLTQEDNIIRYNQWNEDCKFFASFNKIT